ncbi:MAG: insulinase family protein [Herminiimonas sp.]|nr:insulinase family protein [Herminiimonas sp.]
MKLQRLKINARIVLVAGALAGAPYLAQAQVQTAPNPSVSPVRAVALPKGVQQFASIEGITEYRLENGLKVLLLPDASKPTVTVNMTYLVGSRHENYGETGMAHLLEHLLFKGSPKNPRLDQEFNNRGMRSNGTTSLDRTNYYEIFQASGDNLKWAIDMEADRMVNSFVAKKDLDSEMTVVRNEFENGENSPFGVMFKRMQSIAYDWHNYGNSTIGNRSDIEKVRIENLQAFYRTYYQPDNAVLLIAGKFDPAQTLAWVARAFQPIPKPKRTLPVFWTEEPTQDGERAFSVRRKGDVQIIAVAYKIPSSLHPDSDALSFAGDILGDTPNGRLHKQLVETGKAAQVFNYGLTGYAPGLLILGAVVKNGEAIEPVRDAVVAAIEDFKTNPPTKEEIDRVRRNDANQIEKMLNDHQKLGVSMSEYIALGDWRLLFEGRDKLDKMTSQRVNDAAARYLRRDNRTVGLFQPEDKPQRADIPAAPTAAEILKDYKPKTDFAIAESFDPNQDNIDRRTERKKIGGLDVALLPKKNRGETVSVAITLHWGDESSLFGQQTVSGLANAMLTRGTTRFTREQLSDEFDKLKLTGSIYRFDTTRSNLAAALKLAAHVMKEPTFPEAEFEQLRKQTLVGLEASRNDPTAVASEAMNAHFNRYPKGDWRAYQSIDEQIAAVQAVKLADVKAFHQKFYGATKGEIGIVGDFDAAATSALLEQEFGNWKSSVPYARVAMRNFDVPVISKTLDTPDKENGFYSTRQNLDLRDDDPDFPALTLANYIFGGGSGLNSRVMERIRQKDGLSYGGGSSLAAGSIDRAGSFGVSAIAAPQNLAKVDAAIRAELARVAKDGFSAEEVARAKSGLLQQRSQTRAQDSALASGWTSYLFLNRTYAWSKNFENKLSALTAEQVNAAFRRAIDPARMTVVTAGDEGKMKLVTKP